jgi:hypothetical protein
MAISQEKPTAIFLFVWPKKLWMVGLTLLLLLIELACGIRGEKLKIFVANRKKWAMTGGNWHCSSWNLLENRMWKKFEKKMRNLQQQLSSYQKTFRCQGSFWERLGMDVVTSSPPQYSFRFAFESRLAENIHLASWFSTVLQAAGIAWWVTNKKKSYLVLLMLFFKLFLSACLKLLNCLPEAFSALHRASRGED